MVRHLPGLFVLSAQDAVLGKTAFRVGSLDRDNAEAEATSGMSEEWIEASDHRKYPVTTVDKSTSQGLPFCSRFGKDKHA